MGAKNIHRRRVDYPLESSLDIDIEPQYYVLTQQLNAINRKMWDVYRVSTFLVHANNSHKHPARALITDAVEATNTGSTTIRTLIGELEKQAVRRIARATRESKGAQPANPPKNRIHPAHILSRCMAFRGDQKQCENEEDRT